MARKNGGDPATDHMMRAIARFETIARTSRQKMIELRDYRVELLRKLDGENKEKSEMHEERKTKSKQIVEMNETIERLLTSTCTKQQKLTELETQILKLQTQYAKMQDDLEQESFDLHTMQIETDATKDEVDILGDEIEIKEDNISVTNSNLQDVESQMQTHEKLIVEAKEKAEGYRKRKVLLSNAKYNYLQELNDPDSILFADRNRQRQAHFEFLDELAEENSRNPIPANIACDSVAAAV